MGGTQSSPSPQNLPKKSSSLNAKSSPFIKNKSLQKSNQQTSKFSSRSSLILQQTNPADSRISLRQSVNSSKKMKIKSVKKLPGPSHQVKSNDLIVIQMKNPQNIRTLVKQKQMSQKNSLGRKAIEDIIEANSSIDYQKGQSLRIKKENADYLELLRKYNLLKN